MLKTAQYFLWKPFLLFFRILWWIEKFQRTAFETETFYTSLYCDFWSIEWSLLNKRIKKVTDPKSLNGILNSAAFYNLSICWSFAISYLHTHTHSLAPHTPLTMQTGGDESSRVQRPFSSLTIVPWLMCSWMTTHLESLHNLKLNYKQLCLICVHQYQPQINDQRIHQKSFTAQLKKTLEFNSC